MAAPPPPGEARHFSASDGARLCYAVAAPAAGAPPAAGVAVLLHGWSGSRRYWDTVVPLLVARGLTVVAPDLRWHGDSAEGSVAGGPSHVARLGADLAELLAACAEAAAQPRVLLVGSSMGAAVIWFVRERARQRSRRCTLLTQRGALARLRRSYIECFGQARVAGMVAVDQAPLQNRAPGWSVGSKGCYDAPTLANLQAALLADLGRFADDNAACCLAAPLADAALGALLRAETLRCDGARLGALMADHTVRDWRALLPLLRCPVLSVYGTASGVFPPEGCAAVGTAAPRGANVPFQGAGHWLYLEQPAAFAAAVADFAAACAL
jgi:non-heme chloroperoxidase